MIKTTLLSTLLLITSIFIQSTWFGPIAIFGVVPDLSLLILVWLSYKNGPVEGPFSGFLAGLAEDCISASPLGFHAFLKTAVASSASLLHGSFAIDRLFLPLALGSGATLLKALAAGILGLLFGHQVHAYSFLGRDLWIEVAYNAIVAPPAFFLLSLGGKRLVTGSAKE